VRRARLTSVAEGLLDRHLFLLIGLAAWVGFFWLERWPALGPLVRVLMMPMYGMWVAAGAVLQLSPVAGPARFRTLALVVIGFIPYLLADAVVRRARGRRPAASGRGGAA
jgi:hypothetical protein